jgi:hypothetical protein
MALRRRDERGVIGGEAVRSCSTIRLVGVAHAEVVLVQPGHEVPLGPVGHDDRCHLGLVDDLARLQLAALRLGWSIRLRTVSPELAELLDLAGLEATLPHPPAR